jgi:thiol-disulfide isomerase/thioredoxin
MNKFVFLILLGLAACSAPKSDSFQIAGKIMGKAPAKAYLKIYEDGNFKTLDSATFTNGEFKFQGKVDFPDVYLIQVGGNRDFISLFVENAKINVSAHIDSLDAAVITGCAIQDQYDAYKKSKEPFDKQIEALYPLYKEAKVKAEKDIIEAKLDSIDALKTKHVKLWISDNSNSILAPYIIQRELIYYIELNELETLTNALSPELTNYKYTKNLYDRIEVLRLLQPGKPAPEFSQINPDSLIVNLSDFKGEYLLIDFWASWCGPCRRANPTVVAMYNKYHQKGFNILGVSMDKSRENWLKAIDDDGLIWSQVSTLEGWANPVGKLYGVNSIPHAILIDPEGNIVKRGVLPTELDELLGSFLN